MHFWKPGDLSVPPTPKTIKRRRPRPPYWESTLSFYKQTALETFIERWERETGTPHGQVCLQCGNTEINCRNQPCYCVGGAKVECDD